MTSTNKGKFLSLLGVMALTQDTYPEGFSINEPLSISTHKRHDKNSVKSKKARAKRKRKNRSKRRR